MDLNATIEQSSLSPAERDARAGADAERIWNDPTTQSCVAAIREKYVAVILASQIEETEKREHAYRMVHALDELAGEFTARISRGKLKAREITRKSQ